MRVAAAPRELLADLSAIDFYFSFFPPNPMDPDSYSLLLPRELDALLPFSAFFMLIIKSA